MVCTPLLEVKIKEQKKRKLCLKLHEIAGASNRYRSSENSQRTKTETVFNIQ